MKKLTTTLFFLIVFATTCFSQEEQLTEKQKPKATYQVGKAKVTVWENKNADGSTRKNFKIEKVYKKEDYWKTSSYFNEKDLLHLKAAIDKAISEESVNTEIKDK